MWISAGGTIGGIATGLDRAACIQLGGGISAADRARRAVPAGPCAAGARHRAICAVRRTRRDGAVADQHYGVRSAGSTSPVSMCCVGVLFGLTVQFWRAPLPFAAIIAFLLRCQSVLQRDVSPSSVRNFFGVLNVVDTSDGKYRVLWHGTTGQGTQHVRDDDGNPIERPAGNDRGILRRRRHRADVRCGACARRTGRSTMP